MQSGVGIRATVGLPLADFLTEELQLSEDDQSFIDALVLDGMPVDDPSVAIVPDGARLALAAGLPGIAGLAMKKNSAVKALRNTITHAGSTVAAPAPGRITLALYSLVLPRLAAHFLRRGVVINPAQFTRYARFSPDAFCLYGDLETTASRIVDEMSLERYAGELLFTAVIVPEGDK